MGSLDGTRQYTESICEPGYHCVQGVRHPCPGGLYGSDFGLVGNRSWLNVICLGSPNRYPRIAPGPVQRGTTVRQGAPANKSWLAEVLPTSAPWEAPPPLKFLSGTFQSAVTRPPDLTRDLPPWVRMPSSD